MSKVKTKPFDPAEYLDDSESIAAYMSDALESEDPAFVADALGVVARARGRVLLAVERYRKGEASLGKAAEVAGMPVGQMMTILGEFGVRTRIDQEDYRQSLENLAKVW